MNILILGGTGAMGTHLVKLLEDTLNKVYVTSRKSHTDYNNISYLLGDAHDMNFLNKILTQSYDCIIDFMYYSIDEFRLKLPVLQSHTKQYICLSSSRVYADSSSPIKEDNKRLCDVIKDVDYLNSTDYSIEKCRLEDEIIKSQIKNWTIIRPYITYSESRLQLGVYELYDWYYRFLHNRTIQISSTIANSYTTLTYGFDVAKGIASLIGKDKSLCQFYHITQPNSIKWADVLAIYTNAIEKHTGTNPKTQITKDDVFSAIGYIEPQVKYDRNYNRIFDNGKINEFCNTNDFTPAELGINMCIDEFLKNPRTLKPNWWRQALIDRFTGEKAGREEFENEQMYLDYLHTLNDKHILLRNKYYSFRRFVKHLIYN